MKLTISREALLEPLQAVSGVVERRQTLPILSNVLLVAEDGRLTFTATDMEVELFVHMSHKARSPGAITLPARKLLDICRALPSEAKMELEVQGDQVKVRSGRSRFTLSTMPAGDFPSVGEFESRLRFAVPQGILKGLMERTQFAMAHQDVRYYLNGLLLEIDSGVLRAVATDGHRLALSEVPVDVAVEEALQVIVPRKGVSELLRLLGEGETGAEVVVGANHIQVGVGDERFTSKLIDGRFPDYQRVLPSKTDKRVVANRESLRLGLTRTSILSNEKFRGIRLTLEEGRLKALAHNPEQGEAEDEIEVNYSGPPLEIGFNVSYLLDVLSVVDTQEVELDFSDASSSCLIRPVGEVQAQYVVMPMRL